MLKRVLLALFLLFVVVACGGAAAGPTASALPGNTTASPPATSSPSPSIEGIRHGASGLIADLDEAGADAALKEAFNGEPLALDGTLVCVGGEALRVYSYAIPEEAAAAAARIDPRDPSNIGTAIVEWVGEPKFWLRDRIIIVYSGDDEQTTGLLIDLLGDPFARGRGGPALLPDGC